MSNPKVGLITFGDERPHEWEKLFRGLTEPRHAQAVAYLATLPVDLHAAPTVARTKDEIDAQVDALRAAGVEALVAHVPCWTAPNLVVRGIQRLGLPTALLSNKSPATHGTVALLGAGGALDQIGYPHLRVREDFETGRVGDRLLPFARAAAAVRRLRGQVFGLFGGRSLGIDTGTFDPMQWRELFGVDVEHIDQLEIIRRAEAMAEAPAAEIIGWLEANAAGVAYNGQGLTPARLSFQARCYLATRQIVEEKGLDFVAVKCMPDLSTNYVPQCLTAAFLPSPYDAAGAKEPIAMACEADGDGALTMQILKHVSGGKPVLFADLSYLSDETQTIYLPNCGAMCSWYAARSDTPADNLRHIELRPAMRPGGGAITYFRAAPGPLTLARLSRKRGQYSMTILPGEAVAPTAAEYDAFVQARGRHQLPTAFVKVGVSFDRLIDEFGSNHISGVAGTYVEELRHVCRLLDITPIVMDEP
ncbi:MAG: L-fucose isomerase [Anaerolineae bacterium]